MDSLAHSPYFTTFFPKLRAIASNVFNLLEMFHPEPLLVGLHWLKVEQRIQY